MALVLILQNRLIWKDGTIIELKHSKINSTSNKNLFFKKKSVMQAYKHLTDDQVKDLFLQIAQEHASRQQNTVEKAQIYLQKLCKERFPETQIGGTCSIKQCDEKQVVFEFTFGEHMNAVTYPNEAKFVRQENGGFKLYALLRCGRFATTFTYESFKSEGYLRPAVINRVPCKELPAELISLPWISRIIYTAQQVWDVLHME